MRHGDAMRRICSLGERKFRRDDLFADHGRLTKSASREKRSAARVLTGSNGMQFAPVDSDAVVARGIKLLHGTGYRAKSNFILTMRLPGRVMMHDDAQSVQCMPAASSGSVFRSFSIS